MAYGLEASSCDPLISTGSDLICQTTAIDSSSELIAIKIDFADHHPLVICPAYTESHQQQQ